MKGVYTAIVTPFKKGKIDFDALGKLVEKQKRAEIHGLIVAGTTGEAATLSIDEKRELFTFIKENAGWMDIVAGTGGNNTAQSVKETEMALETGVEKVLIVTPYYNKPTCNGLYLHYKSIADTGAKIVLYNVPSRTALNIAPSCLKKLSSIENIIAVKEASGSIAGLTDYLDAVGSNRYDFFSGDDFTIAPFVAMGGKGVISVISNIMPEKVVELVEAGLGGKTEKSSKIQIELNKIIHTMFLETNPLPVKTALSMMGQLEESFRAPLANMEESNRVELKKILKEYNLL